VSEMCKKIEDMRREAAEAAEAAKAEGRAEGKVEGKTEGILETLITLVKKGLLTISQAAAEANMTVHEFETLTGLKA